MSLSSEICNYLQSIPEIKHCKMIGSLAAGNHDKYSDIDIEADVSGYDNSVFITKIPEIMKARYDVVFYDFAPSLIPENYIISLALSEENPFLIVDIKCTATPHRMTLNKSDFPFSKVEHTLKLWVANYKHYIRGKDCYNDIFRMYNRVIPTGKNDISEKEMLIIVLDWLEQNAGDHYQKYIASCKPYLKFLR